VAGYIAPKHLQAIKETGNLLVAAMDVHDSAGVLDRYFPEAAFFLREDDLRTYLLKQKEQGSPVDYLVVCTPNQLHEAHILLGFKSGCDVICEKPVALDTAAVKRLQEAEKQSGHRVYTIMQLRLHPAIIALRQQIANGPADKKYTIQLQYITPRGKWYHQSWKGDIHKSGGILINIGIHLFDLLHWLFGPVLKSWLLTDTATETSGELQLEKATVHWQLSIDAALLPPAVKENGNHAYRLMLVDGDSVDFSVMGNELHTRSYTEIINGKGFELQDAMKGLEVVEGLGLWVEKV
jgi:UDP-N-acetyl-2-amino-2-deoxyglucuronate dehydrogenase